MQDLPSIIHGAVWVYAAFACCSFRDQCKQTLEEFKGIIATLKQQPAGIEELTELREFMDDTPAKLEALAVEIKAALHIFDVLESFKYRVRTAWYQ